MTGVPVDEKLIIEALRRQRNDALDRAAALEAVAETLQADRDALAAQLEDLKPTKRKAKKRGRHVPTRHPG